MTAADISQRCPNVLRERERTLPGLTDVQVNLLGVQRPGDHPHDAVSHRPGEPVSVRGEVHAPRLAPRQVQQRRRPPGLQLQEESWVRRWRKMENRNMIAIWQTHISQWGSAGRLDQFQPPFLSFFPLSFLLLGGFKPCLQGALPSNGAPLRDHSQISTYMSAAAPCCFP